MKRLQQPDGSFPWYSLGWSLAGLFFLLANGCADDGAKQKLEFGQQTVERGLAAWKAGKKPGDLKSAEAPIDFFDDDWNQSAKLIGYTIQESFIEPSDETARCSVLLQVQYENKPLRQVRCAYQIVTEPAVAVARDPMS